MNSISFVWKGMSKICLATATYFGLCKKEKNKEKLNLKVLYNKQATTQQILNSGAL